LHGIADASATVAGNDSLFSGDVPLPDCPQLLPEDPTLEHIATVSHGAGSTCTFLFRSAESFWLSRHCRHRVTMLQAVKEGFSGPRTIEPLVQAGLIAEGAAAFVVSIALLGILGTSTDQTLGVCIKCAFVRISMCACCKQVRTSKGPAVTITCTVTPDGERCAACHCGRKLFCILRSAAGQIRGVDGMQHCTCKDTVR
jgi:hypothetical protein